MNALQVTYRDASEPDCSRIDYIVHVDGEEHCILAAALGTEWSDREAEDRARKLFGANVTLIF